MGKNYDQVSNQVACAKRDSILVAFYPSVEPVPFPQFPELVQGKVKILLDDWSGGKGDQKVSVYFNFDLPDVYYLYERAKLSHLPLPYTSQKIMGGYPVNDPSSPYHGLCRVRKIRIERIPKDGKGEPMRTPWKIEVTNGFARAANGKTPGTYYAEGGTFKDELTTSGKKKSLQIRLTDIEFLDCFRKTCRYLDIYAQIVGQDYIPRGLAELKALREQNNYGGEAYRGPRMGTAGQDPDAAPPYEQHPSLDPRPVPELGEIHPTKVLILSQFNALDDGIMVASCGVESRDGNLRKYRVYFRKGSITDGILEAQACGNPVTLGLAADNKNRLWYTGQ